MKIFCWNEMDSFGFGNEDGTIVCCAEDEASAIKLAKDSFVKFLADETEELRGYLKDREHLSANKIQARIEQKMDRDVQRTAGLLEELAAIEPTVHEIPAALLITGVLYR